MAKSVYLGICDECGAEHLSEWREPYEGYDGESYYAADCRRCGPGYEMTMLIATDDDLEELAEDDGFNDRAMALVVVSRIDDEDDYADRVPEPSFRSATDGEVWSCVTD